MALGPRITSYNVCYTKLLRQRNWIGRSEGAEISFPLEDGSGTITVFTTRPDTIYGATFMSMAPEHPLVLDFARKGGREAEAGCGGRCTAEPSSATPAIGAGSRSTPGVHAYRRP